VAIASGGALEGGSAVAGATEGAGVGVLKQASTVATLVVQVKYNEFTDFVLSFGVICGDISNLLCHLISSVND
jgi:hypothetical protein